MANGTATKRLWHPFAARGKVDGHELVLVRGEGSTVWDDQGNALLDVAAALWFCNVGHGRRELADAAATQMSALETFQTYERYTTPPPEELATRIAGLLPWPGSKVFFTSGGGDAIDTAAKLSRAYWTAVGKPDKRVLVSRQFAYHGSNAYGTALGGIPALVETYGRLVPDVEQVPWDDAESLAATIDLPTDAAAAMATWHRTLNDAVVRAHRDAGSVMPDLNDPRGVSETRIEKAHQAIPPGTTSSTPPCR